MATAKPRRSSKRASTAARRHARAPAAPTFPHAQLPLDRILEGDTIERLAQLPDQCVDLVFADPPYNLQLRNELWRPNRTKVDAVDDSWDRFAGFPEYDAFTRGWLQQCRRVLKDTGTIWVIGSYHNIYRVGTALMDLGFWILNDIVWVKSNPMPNFRGVRFTNAHETLLWAQKVKGAKSTFHHRAMKALNDELQMRSDWRIPLCSGKERIKIDGQKAHSTQKPEALLYRVLLSSSNPGDVVLDPFFGTGTTGAVAQRLGRHWIGIERDPTYVRVATQRLAKGINRSVPHEALEFATDLVPARVPFGALLEQGVLQPGQELYFGPGRVETALVLANGHLRWKGVEGSIHQVGRAITDAPCNGWDHWFYEDPATKNLQVIDVLREHARRNGEDPNRVRKGSAPRQQGTGATRSRAQD